MIYRLMIALALLLWGVQIAQAKRVALVMGNSEYTTFTSLPNPVNDARLMEKALKEVGFEVTLVLNADQAQMKKAMREFGRTLREGVDASLFYYAGHGVQVKGENYLIPTQGDIEHEDEVDGEAVKVNDFLQTLESSKSLFNIIILDACRNNPLSTARSAGGGGLAPVNAPRGSFVAYATAPGAVAEDGDGKNSPYTAALASALVTPGMKLEDVFKKTREIVLNETANRQLPWEASSIIGDFYFFNPVLLPADSPFIGKWGSYESGNCDIEDDNFEVTQTKISGCVIEKIQKEEGSYTISSRCTDGELRTEALWISDNYLNIQNITNPEIRSISFFYPRCK